MIVNAVAHRNCSILGTDIIVKVRLNSALREENAENGREEIDGVGNKETVNVTEKDNVKVNEKVNERQRLIISAVSKNPHITQSELAKILNITVVHINKNMKKLQEKGIIRCVGPDKGGHWEVIEQEDNKQ